MFLCVSHHTCTIHVFSQSHIKKKKEGKKKKETLRKKESSVEDLWMPGPVLCFAGCRECGSAATEMKMVSSKYMKQQHMKKAVESRRRVRVFFLCFFSLL